MPDIAYLDIIGGVSGDMLISAMLDAGLDKAELKRELAKIVPSQFHLDATNTTRGSISATHVDVVFGDSADQRMGWQEFEDCIEASNLPDTDRAKIRSVFECLRAAEAQAHGTPEGKSHLHELGTLDTLIDIAGAVIGMRILGIDTLAHIVTSSFHRNVIQQPRQERIDSTSDDGHHPERKHSTTHLRTQPTRG